MIIFTIILSIIFFFMIFICGIVGPFMKIYDEYKANKIRKELKDRKI